MYKIKIEEYGVQKEIELRKSAWKAFKEQCKQRRTKILKFELM